MTRPKNLNTEYGRRYLNWLKKEKPKSYPMYWTTEEYEEYQKFKKAYFPTYD